MLLEPKMSGFEKEAAKMLLLDDSRSSDAEEFPLSQLKTKKSAKKRRKVIVYKPKHTCVTRMLILVPIIIFICIAGGVAYFIVKMENELDSMQGRIKTLESELKTSTEQALTVSALQQKIEHLQKLPAQISSIYAQIRAVNATNSQLRSSLAAVKQEFQSHSTADIEGLQQSTAQIGSALQGVQSLQTQHTQQIDTLTNSLQQLQTSLTSLQGNVSQLQQEASVPTPKPSDPASDTSHSSEFLDVGKVIQSLQQEQEAMSVNVGHLNTTVATISHWKEALMPRIVALESTPHTSDTTDDALAEKVTQLQSQVNTLMSSIHSQTPDGETGHQTSNSTTSDVPTDWRRGIESDIQVIQKQLDELNPRDLNNNLLNENTTRGIQQQLERALSLFKAENLKSVDDVKQDNQAIWGRLYQQHGDITDMQKEVDDLQVRVQDLEKDMGHSPGPTSSQSSVRLSTVSESSTQHSVTHVHQQPITIPEISTVDELEMKFFIMDDNDDDLLSYAELKDFFGPNAPPKDQLMQFDKNLDDKLSLDELKTALGFQEQ
ncbi:EF-hand calcium-binding domain-containing protein 14-like isoform X2 [Acanthaster planci]|uniref:EF-hand calcium-binding domain-containing protein 14-like isoform X2 n=2 Tax=Acanthaster planci TaxID=133434 RepID=A0A8B7Y3K7_ACAPL|nr:EF-hand calcium-binding domain-containing protein 14-like isoform X2 [Acanthaster planci]